jgi:hypothetical protein
MMELLHRKFRFPSSCNMQEAVIRETNGVDEQQAALAASLEGERGSLYSELIRLSIVEVDGEKVTQPFLAMDGFNSRTRAFLIRAYESLNDVKEEELAAFLGASEDVTLSLAEVPASKVEPLEGRTASTGG